MKPRSVLLACLGLSFFACRVLAAPHYEVTFSGSIATQATFTGTSATLHTAKVNNASIFKMAMAQAALSGTTIATAKDLALVFDPAKTELDVIDIADPTHISVLYAIVVEGSRIDDNGTVYSGNVRKILGVSTISDVEVTLPGDDTFTCNATSYYSYNPISEIPTSFTISLAGNDTSSLMMATIRKAKKIYGY